MVKESQRKESQSQKGEIYIIDNTNKNYIQYFVTRPRLLISFFPR